MCVTDGFDHAEREIVFVVSNVQNQPGIELVWLGGSADTHQNPGFSLPCDQGQSFVAFRAGNYDGYSCAVGQSRGRQPHSLTVGRIDDFKYAINARAFDRNWRGRVMMTAMNRQTRRSCTL